MFCSVFLKISRITSHYEIRFNFYCFSNFELFIVQEDIFWLIIWSQLFTFFSRLKKAIIAIILKKLFNYRQFLLLNFSYLLSWFMYFSQPFSLKNSILSWDSRSIFSFPLLKGFSWIHFFDFEEWLVWRNIIWWHLFFIHENLGWNTRM